MKYFKPSQWLMWLSAVALLHWDLIRGKGIDPELTQQKKLILSFIAVYLFVSFIVNGFIYPSYEVDNLFINGVGLVIGETIKIGLIFGLVYLISVIHPLMIPGLIYPLFPSLLGLLTIITWIRGILKVIYHSPELPVIPELGVTSISIVLTFFALKNYGQYLADARNKQSP